MKEKVLKLLDQMFEDIDPRILVKNYVKWNKALVIEGKSLYTEGKIYVIGCGRASVKMAQAVEEVLGNNIEAGLIISPVFDNLNIIEVIEGSHPLITEKSILAGKRMLDFIDQIQEKDIVIGLWSGGGSALMVVPKTTASEYI